jgi:hypothetical protein
MVYAAMSNFVFSFSGSRARTRFLLVTLLSSLMLMSPVARSVEVLSIHELVIHCELLPKDPEGVDAQYCIRYIQGFIDGAVATDAWVMLEAEAELGRQETFSERAKRTRVPSLSDRVRAARLAGFCLGDPLPLRAVVDVVVADLAAMDVGPRGDSPAREAVYESLRDHYPCEADS